jgi:hypothetical protein
MQTRQVNGKAVCEIDLLLRVLWIDRMLWILVFPCLIDGLLMVATGMLIGCFDPLACALAIWFGAPHAGTDQAPIFIEQ